MRPAQRTTVTQPGHSRDDSIRRRPQARHPGARNGRINGSGGAPPTQPWAAQTPPGPAPAARRVGEDRSAAEGGAGLVTPATRGAADTCFTGREGGFMIRSGDGGGARRELRSPPTVPAQRGTGGCVPHDCDLTAAGIPADGTSCRYCQGVTHTARRDGRDAPEPARLAHRYQCRGDSVYAITGRRSLGLDLPPEFSRFLAYPCRAGQLSPVGDPLRRYCGSTNTAQCARPRRPRPCCRDGAGGGPGEERAGRGLPPESADRYLSGIPRHPGGAIPRPIRDRCPDPAPLTATPVRETCASCARRHPCGCRGRILRARRALGSQPGRRCAYQGVPAHRTGLVHRKRVGHPGRPEIEQE